MVSSRGPIPKRQDERIGHAHEAMGSNPIDKVDGKSELKIPPPNPGWVEIAQFAYQAFIDSPVNSFYTETDIAFGWMTAQAIHDAIIHPSATRTLAAESMMKSAMFAEGDRRRVRVEVTRKPPEKNPVLEKNVADFEARRRQRSG